MATVKWNKKARRVFTNNLRYAKFEFGAATARRWYEERHEIEYRLCKYPESYPPEPLINKRKIYRWAKIVSNFKIIYYYSPTSDVVHVVDIWDMRMNPDVLRNRI